MRTRNLLVFMLTFIIGLSETVYQGVAAKVHLWYPAMI